MWRARVLPSQDTSWELAFNISKIARLFRTLRMLCKISQGLKFTRTSHIASYGSQIIMNGMQRHNIICGHFDNI